MSNDWSSNRPAAGPGQLPNARRRRALGWLAAFAVGAAFWALLIILGMVVLP